MTSLAKQLQRLAVPHTQAALGDDKKRASLLFDSREASNFDRETFHALGLNGIEELTNIDPNFEDFETVLFGEATLSFERSVQTKEVNDKLDENLRCFLVNVSPYCLLKPAHKALEWLIHRFSIHLYNTDDLLLCFLPYHESNVFARVLQVVSFNSKQASKWDFLEPLQKNGLPLTRTTLVNHCRTDLGFLSFVCDIVPRAVKILTQKNEKNPKCRVLFSFYATTIIGVLDSGGVREELLGLLLPHLSRGLKSPVTEYKAATYMVLAQLLYKAALKQSILTTVLHLLVKGMVSSLMEEAVACLLLMFQTQDVQGMKLKHRTFKYLCQHHNLVSVISDLSSQFEANLFLDSFVTRLIPAAFDRAVGLATSGESSESDSSLRPVEYIALLHQLLSNIKLPDDMAENAAFLFLKKYVQHGNKYLDEDVDNQIKDSLQGIVRQLEGKHSAAVDRAVGRMLESCGTQRERDLVQEFLNLYVLSVPHHLVTDAETSLVLSLNHRLPAVREKAVSMLVKNRHAVDDDDLLSESLTLRLKDEDPAVVLAALAIGKDIWTVMEDDSMVIGLLKMIVVKGLASKKWLPAAIEATKLSGTYTGERTLEVISSYLPCFYLLHQAELPTSSELVNILLKSKLATKSKLLQTVAREMKKDKQTSYGTGRLAVVNQTLAKYIAKGLVEMKDENGGLDIVTTWTEQAVGHHDIRLVSLVLVVLDELVAMATDTKEKLTICRHQLRLIAVAEITKGLPNDSCSLEDLGSDWSRFVDLKSVAPYGKKLSTAMCMKALHSIVKVMQVPTQLAKDAMFWHHRGDGGEGDMFLGVCVQLYDMLLQKVMMATRDNNSLPTYRQLFKLLEKQCFSDSSVYLKFLGLMWTQHGNDLADDLGLTLTLQARSLHLGLAFIKSLDGSALATLFQNTSFFCALLMVLTSDQAAIRSGGLQIATELLARQEGEGSVYKPLLRKVVRCEGEIQSDSSFIYQAVASVFKSTSLEQEPAASRSRRLARKSVGTSPGKPDKGDKSKCLQELFILLVEEKTPYYVQHKLLEVFILLDNKDALTRLLPLMSRLLALPTEGTQPRLAVQSLNLILRRFTPTTAACLAPGTPGLQLVLKALQQHRENMADLMSPQMVALEQISKELYGEVAPGAQQKLLSALFDVCVDTRDLKVSSQVLRVLKHIHLDGNHIQEELKRCLKQPTAKTVREAKRQKKVAGDDIDDMTEFDTRDWHRSIIVLEAVQNKKKLQNYTGLAPVCFQLLASVLDSDNHASAEYIKQLVLSVLYNICSRLEKKQEDGQQADEESLPEEQFNMELIVNCIRSSDNPQTHHQALLLLTSAANIFSELLVHNMMSIFTFMGQSILRQDDAYSFHIISKILETVIPALITASKQGKKAPSKGSPGPPEDIITMVIQVFVDSYPHMPNHRRQLLFHKLLTVIGGDAYLWRTLLLMMDQVVAKGTLKAELATEETESSLYTSDMEFCLTLCGEFPTTVQFAAATNMMKFLMRLPDEKDDDSPRKQPSSKGKKEEAAIFDLALHTDKQLRLFKYATIHLLIGLFSSTDLLAQLSYEVTEAEGYADLASSFQVVLETLLQLVTHVTTATNRFSDKPTAKYWKALHHKTHDLLDKFVNLLPDTLFIEVIGGLLGSHDLPTIQRKALDLLNGKLQQQRDFTESETKALLPMVRQLVTLVRRLLLGSEITEEGSVNGQAAFISLKLLCRTLGFENPDSFVKVLKTAVEVFNRTSVTNLPVCSCALLCVAEICSSLKVYVIEQMASFVPALIASMKDLDTLVQNELYLLSVVTTISKVVENLSKFLSPYLLDITVCVCVMSTRSTEVDVLQKSQVQVRLRAIRSTLSSSIDTRVLVPIVEKGFKKLIKKGDVRSIASLMSLFGDHIGHITRDDLLSELSKLQALFLQCLNLRMDHAEIAPATLSEVEGVTIETIIDMVMKLSESTFKPFLFKLFDWATSSDEVRDRVLVFYRLADRLAERLRSLFTLFAGHIISHVAKILESNNQNKTEGKFFTEDKKQRKKSCQLLVYVLDCVYRCCLYDTEGFITRDRFDTLMQPLVDQIENTQGGEARYTERVQAHLVPCIVQLAVAAQDDSLWRTLNYQVCLTTRAEEPEVKLSALQVLDGLHRKLGEDYMPLLPDAVPFLSELMEDESEEVEKKCHEVIREMERTLGEPLQKYF